MGSFGLGGMSWSGSDVSCLLCHVFAVLFCVCPQHCACNRSGQAPRFGSELPSAQDDVKERPRCRRTLALRNTRFRFASRIEQHPAQIPPSVLFLSIHVGFISLRTGTDHSRTKNDDFPIVFLPILDRRLMQLIRAWCGSLCF